MQKDEDITKEEFLKGIGTRVKNYREQRGLSQFQLAIEAEIPKNQVGRIERGQVNTSVYNLKRVADALGVNVVELMKN